MHWNWANIACPRQFGLACLLLFEVWSVTTEWLALYVLFSSFAAEEIIAFNYHSKLADHMLENSRANKSIF